MRLSKRGPQANPDLLLAVREAFARFRRERPGTRPKCPEAVRRIALAAIAAGHRAAVVEEAAGIAHSTLSRWRRRERAKEKNAVVSMPAEGQVRELRIVNEHREPAPMSSESRGSQVLVRLGHQVAIEMPAAAMTESFLRALVAASAGGVP